MQKYQRKAVDGMKALKKFEEPERHPDGLKIVNVSESPMILVVEKGDSI